MEYVFGTQGKNETLKTKGLSHSNLTGYRQLESIYPDQTITDCFRVVKKFHSAEDTEGNCYDWYIIDSHYRTIDKSAPVIEKVEDLRATMEDLLCEQDALIDARLSAIENASCELDVNQMGGATDERDLGEPTD